MPVLMIISKFQRAYSVNKPVPKYFLEFEDRKLRNQKEKSYWAVSIWETECLSYDYEKDSNISSFFSEFIFFLV